MARIGPIKSTLDEKGRITIPKPLRELYQGKLVVTLGLENCAWVMTDAFFDEKFTKRLDSKDQTPEQRLVLEARHISFSEDIEMDSQGRIPVPTALREFIGLSKECMVLNAKNRLSIWDKEQYFAYLKENAPLAREGFNKLGSNDIFSSEEG